MDAGPECRGKLYVSCHTSGALYYQKTPDKPDKS